MRFSRFHAVSPSTTTILTTTFLALLSSVTANPYPRLASNTPALELANALEIRACANPCGWEGKYCCSSDQQCYTDANNIAACTAGAAVAATPAAEGNWQLFTTVYVSTEEIPKTFTDVYSLQAAAGATVTVTVFGSQPTAATCNVNLGLVQCGLTCCGAGQFCNSGVCMANGATTSGGGLVPVATATVSAPVRPTSISTYTVFTTNGATSTVPFLMPATATAGANATASASTSGSSLSGGAIAGIVIGVLAGIIILILLIICCCARGLLDLFRPKRKTEVTEIYEGHHHSGGGGAPPRRRFGIFGGGGGNNSSSNKKSGFLGVAGILAALALVLGLKRRHDRKNDEKASTAYTYSDYTYDYSTSASSESSDDRRTRNARSNRGSRR